MEDNCASYCSFAVTRHRKEKQFKGGGVHSGLQRGAHASCQGRHSNRNRKQLVTAHLQSGSRVNGKWDQTKTSRLAPLTYFRLQDSAF